MKLMITEKKTQATDISKFMGWKESSGCFKGSFEGDEIVVLWARGHLISLAMPSEINKSLPWNDPSALVPIPSDFIARPIPDMPKVRATAQPRYYLERIGDYIHQVDEVILATDSDREGEAIGWNILSHFDYTGDVRRCWLAEGLDKKSVTDAMSSLRPAHVTKSWARASESRSRADFSYMYPIRAMTHYAKYGVLGNALTGLSGSEGVISFGRVQGPTLGMIVERERTIRNFKPQDHFKLGGIFLAENIDISAGYKPVVTKEVVIAGIDGVSWDERGVESEEDLPTPLFVDKNSIEAFKGRLLASADQSIITELNQKVRREQPPKTYSLTSAQADIGKVIGASGSVVKATLEDLYEQGWMSYARTGKAELPINFFEQEELMSVLKSIAEVSELSEAVNEVVRIHQGQHETISQFTPSIFVKKGMEHHGMVPTHQKMTDQSLASIKAKKQVKGKVLHTDNQMRVAWLMMAKRYLQALFPPALYNNQQIKFKVPVVDLLNAPESLFAGKLEESFDSGWRKPFGKDKGLPNDKLLTNLSSGASCLLKDVLSKSAKTTTPGRFTLVSLPTEMKNAAKYVKDKELKKKLEKAEGIGQPGTRDTVIETLEHRKYIESDKKGVITPTKRGEALHDVLPKELTSPIMSALWEQELEHICTITDDNEAISLRDKFVDRQLLFCEKMIKDLMQAHDNSIIGKQPVFVASKITPKMKAAIKAIAESENIKIEKGVLTNPVKASEFLRVHGGKPSPKQLALAKRIIAEMPKDSTIKFDEKEVMTSRKACSEFLNEAMKSVPPSEKQIALAKSLAEKMPEGEKPSDSIYTDRSACSQFIEKVFSKSKKKGPQGKSGRPPSEKQVALVKKMIEELDDKDKPKDDVLTDSGLCSAFIDKIIKNKGPKKAKKSKNKSGF